MAIKQTQNVFPWNGTLTGTAMMTCLCPLSGLRTEISGCEMVL